MVDFTKAGQVQAENTPESGGFTREPLKAGAGLLRLSSYIELGEHDAKNPKHPARRKCIMDFEVKTEKHQVETKEGKSFSPNHRFRCNVTTGSLGKWQPMFESMNKAYDNTYSHPIQMLGKAFMCTFEHSENLREDGTPWVNFAGDKVAKAEHDDPITGKVSDLPVAEMESKPIGFLFEPAEGVFTDAEYLECWESLFIEGENDKGESKNWIQDTIREANDFPGSRLQALLGEANEVVVGGGLPDLDAI